MEILSLGLSCDYRPQLQSSRPIKSKFSVIAQNLHRYNEWVLFLTFMGGGLSVSIVNRTKLCFIDFICLIILL
jgi:hypothetical protein